MKPEEATAPATFVSTALNQLACPTARGLVPRLLCRVTMGGSQGPPLLIGPEEKTSLSSVGRGWLVEMEFCGRSASDSTDLGELREAVAIFPSRD